jgi:hypothetical protein
VELGLRAEFEYVQITENEIEAAAHYWLLGKALLLAKPGVERGQWKNWLKAHGIETTKAFRARRLAKAFAVVGDLAGLTLREALALACATETRGQTDVVTKALRRLKAMIKALQSIQDGLKDHVDGHKACRALEHLEQAAAIVRRTLTTTMSYFPKSLPQKMDK